jgi:hypothetical protein
VNALLVFQTPQIDRPLDLISPWLEMRTRRRDEVFALYDAQTHRRFIKSHTPLDGLPADVPPPPPRPDFTDDRDAFLHWVDNPAPPEDVPMSLASTVHHLETFWAERHRDDVVLLHYDDLQADLEGEMRRLADRLGIVVPESRWPTLVEAATFAAMRRRADVVAPDTANRLWKSNAGFFHRGTSGQWRDRLDAEALAHYQARLRDLAPPDVAAWLHHEDPVRPLPS